MSLNQDLPLPPAPPPPPTSLLVQSPAINLKKLKFLTEDDLAIVCKDFSGPENNLMEPIFWVLNSAKPQIQEGPKCGLVALSIATSSNDFRTANQLYQMAFLEKYTLQGEIFSAHWLKDLIHKSNCGDALVIENGLTNHINCILQTLHSGNYVLIPYDTDHNHAPCCKLGHKAHWAVCCGFVLFRAKEKKIGKTSINICSCTKNFIPLQDQEEKLKKFNLEKEHVFNLYGTNVRLMDDNTFGLVPSESNDSGEPVEVYLLCLQGKSCHLGLWSFLDMTDSNLNLIEVDPSRSISEYIIPEGGIEHCLKGKVILLKTKNN